MTHESRLVIRNRHNWIVLVDLVSQTSESNFKYFRLSLLLRSHCDITRKDSVQSHHTIVDLYQEFCDFIGHRLFSWHHSENAWVGIIFDIKVWFCLIILGFINQRLVWQLWKIHQYVRWQINPERVGDNCIFAFIIS